MDNNRRHDDDDDLDYSVTPTRRHSNVFGDEYEVDLDGMVADGFRPNDTVEQQQQHVDPPIRTASAHYASRPAMVLSRNSTRKSRSYENPFFSPEDDAETPLTRTPSMHSQSTANFAPGIARRSISSASSHQFAGTSSPRLAGASGPSHPYAMYPQGTLARTPSVATASTSRPSHLRTMSSARNAPQHPYAMYTQGVAQSENGDEDEEHDDETEAQRLVPVGFGSSQPYRRVRGPEGEEQGIIGEYGHAEQLPPYSRYPDEGPAKAQMPAETPLLTVPETLHSRGPVEGTDPTMPLMHQQITQQSMTDASNLEQSAPLLPTSNRSITDGSSLGEKSWKEKSWKERRRTKVCGIPFKWIIVVGIVVGVIFAILIGSLAGFIAGSRHSTTSSKSVVVTSLYDASVIASPTNAPPTGTFALTLGTPQATQSECLTVPSQRAAWNCDLAGKPGIAMTVGMPPSSTPTQGAFLFYASNDQNLSYGAQYQALNTQFSPFIPVQDNDNPNYGPAFFFQQTYDKIVVVPENAFPPPGPNGKRDFQLDPALINRKQKTQIGDKPWFCIFNNTQLEGFIYVKKPACLNNTNTHSSSASKASTTTSSTWSSITSNPYASYGRPSSIPDAATSGLAWASSIPTNAAAAAAIHATQTNTVQARGAQHQDTYSGLYPYPYMVKIEERRMPNNPVTPYCQQYQILNDAQYNWVPDASGNPIKFNLEESDPPFTAYQSAGIAGNSRRGNVQGACHCQWMHGE